MNMDKSIEELNASELGTLEYWEKNYSLEIGNFNDYGDVGEIWFGNNSSKKIVEFVSTNLNLSKEQDKIIDIGCGNGMTLVDFAKVGFQNLTGIDYSQKAIDLARKVVDKKGFPSVKLQVYDILEPTNACEDQISEYKLVHDKGTYDAISLHSDNPKDKCEKYVKNIHKILSNKGFFALSSCNWTKSELVERFKDYFELIHELATKTFVFGGQTGNKITQLVFKKK